jgi:hypothetical protein
VQQWAGKSEIIVWFIWWFTKEIGRPSFWAYLSWRFDVYYVLERTTNYERMLHENVPNEWPCQQALTILKPMVPSENAPRELSNERPCQQALTILKPMVPSENAPRELSNERPCQQALTILRPMVPSESSPQELSKHGHVMSCFDKTLCPTFRIWSYSIRKNQKNIQKPRYVSMTGKHWETLDLDE